MNGDEKALLKRWMLYCGLRCFKWMDWIGIGWVSLGGMRYRAPYDANKDTHSSTSVHSWMDWIGIVWVSLGDMRCK